MLTNPEQFAAQGAEWGALPDAPPARHSWRRKVHPDGFVEYTLREESDASPGILDWDAPEVAPQEHGESSRAVNPFHALILARKARRDEEVVARRKAHVFVSAKRSENFQAPDEDAILAKRQDDHMRWMLIERRKVGAVMSLDHWCAVIRLFGSWAAYQEAR